MSDFHLPAMEKVFMDENKLNYGEAFDFYARADVFAAVHSRSWRKWLSNSEFAPTPSVISF
jgi:hypothetical protein